MEMYPVNQVYLNAWLQQSLPRGGEAAEQQAQKEVPVEKEPLTLLEVKDVRFKRINGSLKIMMDSLAFVADVPCVLSFRVSLFDIKSKKVSPAFENRTYFKLYMHNGCWLKFRFVNPEGIMAQVDDRQLVESLLSELFPHIDYEYPNLLHRKAEALITSPRLSLLYKKLVMKDVMTTTQFWEDYASDELSKLVMPYQRQSIHQGFLSPVKSLADPAGSFRYHLTSQMAYMVLKTYPALKIKLKEVVPVEMSEEAFWKDFCQSHYFHRDLINDCSDDVFARCWRIDEAHLRKALAAIPHNSYLNVDYFYDWALEEGFCSTIAGHTERYKSDNMVHLEMLRRFNQHSIMVLNAKCSKVVSKYKYYDYSFAEVTPKKEFGPFEPEMGSFNNIYQTGILKNARKLGRRGKLTLMGANAIFQMYNDDSDMDSDGSDDSESSSGSSSSDSSEGSSLDATDGQTNGQKRRKLNSGSMKRTRTVKKTQGRPSSKTAAANTKAKTNKTNTNNNNNSRNVSGRGRRANTRNQTNQNTNNNKGKGAAGNTGNNYYDLINNINRNSINSLNHNTNMNAANMAKNKNININDYNNNNNNINDANNQSKNRRGVMNKLIARPRVYNRRTQKKILNNIYADLRMDNINNTIQRSFSTNNNLKNLYSNTNNNNNNNTKTANTNKNVGKNTKNSSNKGLSKSRNTQLYNHPLLANKNVFINPRIGSTSFRPSPNPNASTDAADLMSNLNNPMHNGKFKYSPLSSLKPIHFNTPAPLNSYTPNSFSNYQTSNNTLKSITYNTSNQCITANAVPVYRNSSLNPIYISSTAANNPLNAMKTQNNQPEVTLVHSANVCNFNFGKVSNTNQSNSYQSGVYNPFYLPTGANNNSIMNSKMVYNSSRVGLGGQNLMFNSGFNLRGPQLNLGGVNINSANGRSPNRILFPNTFYNNPFTNMPAINGTMSQPVDFNSLNNPNSIDINGNYNSNNSFSNNNNNTTTINSTNNNNNNNSTTSATNTTKKNKKSKNKCRNDHNSSASNNHDNDGGDNNTNNNTSHNNNNGSNNNNNNNGNNNNNNYGNNNSHNGNNNNNNNHNRTKNNDDDYNSSDDSSNDDDDKKKNNKSKAKSGNKNETSRCPKIPSKAAGSKNKNNLNERNTAASTGAIPKVKTRHYGPLGTERSRPNSTKYDGSCSPPRYRAVDDFYDAVRATTPLTQAAREFLLTSSSFTSSSLSLSSSSSSSDDDSSSESTECSFSSATDQYETDSPSSNSSTESSSSSSTPAPTRKGKLPKSPKPKRAKKVPTTPKPAEDPERSNCYFKDNVRLHHNPVPLLEKISYEDLGELHIGPQPKRPQTTPKDFDIPPMEIRDTSPPRYDEMELVSIPEMHWRFIEMSEEWVKPDSYFRGDTPEGALAAHNFLCASIINTPPPPPPMDVPTLSDATKEELSDMAVVLVKLLNKFWKCFPLTNENSKAKMFEFIENIRSYRATIIEPFDEKLRLLYPTTDGLFTDQLHRMIESAEEKSNKYLM